MFENISLAILSWGAHKTLINTLESYNRTGLLATAKQRIIYFQEKSLDDITIAKDYGFEWEGTSTNIGISGGYAALLGAATEGYFLFLENDWESVAPNAFYTATQLGTAEALLETGVADLVRLRSRSNPGNPLWTMQFKGREYDRPTHLLDCVHWEPNPERFNEITEILPKVYVTSSQNANWTNNPHIAYTEFLRENILPRLTSENDIERDIQSWWEQQEFKVAQGDGLFTHNRIG